MTKYEIEHPGNYPKDYLEKLGNVKRIKDHNQERTETVVLLALDLRNFTLTMEREQQIGYEGLRSLLETFYSLSSNEIQKNKGATVNKLLGDGLLAYFPKDLFLNAIESAFQIMGFFESLKKRYELTHLGLSIALLFGETKFFNLGRDQYADYAMISRHVNRLFRILNKAKGGRIMIDKDLHVQINAIISTALYNDKSPKIGYNIIKLPSRIYDGIGHPIDAYWLLNKKSDFLVDCKACDLYDWCLHMYNKGRSTNKNGIVIDICCNECDEKVICEERENGNDVCSIAKIKINFNEAAECCHVCKRYYICSKNYWLGYSDNKMIPCAKERKMIDIVCIEFK